MKTFQCVVENPIGIHARPAALIAQLCVTLRSQVTRKNSGITSILSIVNALAMPRLLAASECEGLSFVLFHDLTFKEYNDNEKGNSLYCGGDDDVSGAGTDYDEAGAVGDDGWQHPYCAVRRDAAAS